MDKYFSRKFILAILSIIGGVAVSLTAFGGKAALIGAIVSAVVPAVAYIVTEGVIDAKAVDLSAAAAKQIITIVKDKDGYFTYSEGGDTDVNNG